MIAAAMAYMFAVTLLLALAALAAERVAALNHWPRRLVWAAAMAGSFAIPCIAFLFPREAASTALPRFSTSQTALDQGGDGADGVLAWFSAPSWSTWTAWDTLLIVVWATASAVMLCLLALTSLRLHRRARDWPRRDVEGVCAWVSDDVGPAVFGLFKPRIVLPLWLLDAPARVRRLAVQHEQTHIAGRDPSLLIAALILVAMAPWNPALWLLLRRLRFAIELDCDARLLRSGLDAALYSETLLAVSQRQSRTPLGALAMSAPVSHLERRIRIMLTEKSRRYAWAGIGFLLLAAAPAAYAAALQAPVTLGALAAARSDEATAEPRLSRTEREIDALRALAANAPSAAELSAARQIPTLNWTERPDGRTFIEFYPSDALRREQSGRVVLDCLVVADGRLRCAIAEEDPSDALFGFAALGIAQSFRVTPEIGGQSTAGGRIRLPILFRLASD